MTNIEILELLTFYQRQIDKVISKAIIQYYKKKFNDLFKKLNRHSVEYDYETPQDIINLMISEFNAPNDFAKNKTRKREYVDFRQKTIAICYEIWGKSISLKGYGSYFNQNHANIIYSIETVLNMVKTNNKYRKEFEEMQKYFLGSIVI